MSQFKTIKIRRASGESKSRLEDVPVGCTFWINTMLVMRISTADYNTVDLSDGQCYFFDRDSKVACVASTLTWEGERVGEV